MRTTDGGKTWTSVGGEIVAPSAIYAMCFPSANHGWVVGYDGYIAHYHGEK